MLHYQPGDSLAHRLDPRTKLLFQVAFAAAAFAYTTPRGLLTFGALGVLALAGADTNPLRVLWAYRFVLPFLLAAPLVAMVTLGSPWLVPSEGVGPALASVRNLIVVVVCGGYVRTTSIADSRAAIQRTVPGRPGQFLGLGIELVARFLPVLRRDLLAILDAEAARLGTDRPLRERIATVATAGLNRAFRRADRLSMAMQARCLSWNPTLPPLRFGWIDGPVVGLSVLLLTAAVVRLAGVSPLL
ncbi:MAG: energy-coupling factor transporter transmembrane component T [Euryarchaeota archaeon]|nr:energy-coupling factor transporter transmembrane component T [Euryarchaeota archaeon]